MCKRLSTRDRVLMYINQYIADHGIAPTLREIADGLGLSSPGSVHRHVTILKREGLLQDYAPRKSRSIVLSGGIQNGMKDEKHICLKTDNGETIILNMAVTQGEVRFGGPFCLRGQQSTMGQIIACSELGEEEYYASFG